MIVYGIILILVLAAGGYFIWLKAVQQREYTQVVEQIETTKSYQGMDDIALLKLAAAGDMKACSFIKDHNMYYACEGKYWERGDCTFDALIGEEDKCNAELAVKARNPVKCLLIKDATKATECADKMVALALEMNNVSLCDFAPANKKFVCASKITIKSNDATPCLEYSAGCERSVPSYMFDEMKVKCGIVKPADSIYFKNRAVETTPIQDCVFFSAAISKDPSRCEQVSEEVEEEEGSDFLYSPFDYCVAITAIASGNKDACVKIKSGLFKILCDAGTRGSKEFCGSLPGDENKLCGFVASDDYSGCLELSSTNEKLFTMCKSIIAAKIYS
jgi:hypothetical protein